MLVGHVLKCHCLFVQRENTCDDASSECKMAEESLPVMNVRCISLLVLAETLGDPYAKLSPIPSFPILRP